MKKMSKKILFIAFIMFGFMMGVRAESETCTAEDMVRLRNIASMVSVNYETVDIYADNESPRTDLDVKIRNLNDNLYILVSSPYLKQKISVDKKNKNSKGEIVIRKSNLNQVEQMTFIVYSYGNCNNDPLKIINLTIPKFNRNSRLAICSDVPEYYLCQPLITYDIKNVDYAKSIAEYKKKMANQENKPALENKSDENSGIAGFVSNNKYLIVGIVVAIGIALTVIVLKKKGSSVK